MFYLANVSASTPVNLVLLGHTSRAPLFSTRAALPSTCIIASTRRNRAMFAIGFGEHDFRLRFLFDRSPLSAFASFRIALARSSSSPGFRKGAGALAQIGASVQHRRGSLAVGSRRCPSCCFGVTL